MVFGSPNLRLLGVNHVSNDENRAQRAKIVQSLLKALW